MGRVGHALFESLASLPPMHCAKSEPGCLAAPSWRQLAHNTRMVGANSELWLHLEPIQNYGHISVQNYARKGDRNSLFLNDSQFRTMV
jgi:hypothetical protein